MMKNIICISLLCSGLITVFSLDSDTTLKDVEMDVKMDKENHSQDSQAKQFVGNYPHYGAYPTYPAHLPFGYPIPGYPPSNAVPCICSMPSMYPNLPYHPSLPTGPANYPFSKPQIDTSNTTPSSDNHIPIIINKKY